MIFTLLTFFSAISISVIAAGYSIMGLATLFSGAVIPIIAMGTALEIGKLVSASWLYQNWKNSNVSVFLKTYLFSAIVILVFITICDKNSFKSVICVLIATLFSHSNSAHIDLNSSFLHSAGRI